MNFYRTKCSSFWQQTARNHLVGCQHCETLHACCKAHANLLGYFPTMQQCSWSADVVSKACVEEMKCGVRQPVRVNNHKRKNHRGGHLLGWLPAHSAL